MAGIEDVFGQKDDDLDLYDDFILPNADQKYAAKVNQKEHTEDLERENEALKLRISAFEKELESTKNINLALRRNISVLYKTAKQEIDAKNSLIRDLQARYDSLVFRRSNCVTASFRGSANLSFSDNASSSSHIPDTAIEGISNSDRSALYCDAESSNNSCFSPSSRSERAQTYSRHHHRSRSAHLERPAVLPINRCTKTQTSRGVQEVCISDNCTISKHTKDSYLSGSNNNSLENDRLKDKVGLKLNSDVLNLVSIDSLIEITKLCEASSPKNSKKSMISKNSDITDAERVLAHYKHKAKVTVAQNDTKHILKRAIATVNNQKYNDNIARCQAQRSKSPVSSHEHRQYSKHVKIHHGTGNHKQKNGQVYSKSSSNCSLSNTNSDNSKTLSVHESVGQLADFDDLQRHQKTVDMSSIDRSSIENASSHNNNGMKDADVPTFQKNEDSSYDLLMKHRLESKRETTGKTTATLRCIDESLSLQETMSKGCHIDGSQGHQNSDLKDIYDKKNDVCRRYFRGTTIEKTYHKRYSVESLSLPTSNSTTIDRLPVECKEKFSAEHVKSNRDMKSDCRKSYERVRPDDQTSYHLIDSRNKHTPHLISCGGSNSRPSKRSEKSNRMSVAPHRISRTEKHRHNEPEKEKSRLHHNNSRESHTESSSLKRDHSTKYCAERENKTPLPSTSSSSGKPHIQSHDSCNRQSAKPKHSSISHSSKSHTTSNGTHKDKCETQASCLQESSKKRKLIDLDSLSKNGSDVKEARIKRDHHKFTKNRKLPYDKDCTSKSVVLIAKTVGSSFGANTLEEGELLSEEEL